MKISISFRNRILFHFSRFAALLCQLTIGVANARGSVFGYTLLDLHTVTWYVNGVAYTTGSPSTSVESDSKVSALPTAPADNTLNDCANKFMGWSTMDIGSTPITDAAGIAALGLFTDVAGSPTITANTNFYAVFAEQSSPDANTVIWSEDFTGATITNAISSPTSPTVYSNIISYSCKDGTSTKTRVVTGTYACGTTPEILIGGKGSFSVLYIPAYIGATLTISYKQNANQLYVYTSGTSVTSLGQNQNTIGLYSFDISCVSNNTFNLRFEATTSSNVRLDDIELKVKTPGYTNYVTACADDDVRVSYDFAGGTGSACTEGVQTKTDVYTICSTEPTRAGYTFNGWSDGSTTYSPGGTYNLQATTVFTAQWTALTDYYYDYMHANAQATTQSGQYTAPLLSDQSEPGMNTDCKATHYSFVGWVLAGEVDTDGTLISGYTLISGGQTGMYATTTNYYAVWASDAEDTDTYLAWCDPDITISGDIYLTSYKNIYVNSTSATNNLINISSTDLAGVTSLVIGYLDGTDSEIAKTSSLFRLCNDGTSNYNMVDASSSTIDVSASNVYDQNYSIRYTPNAYGQLDNGKLQITMKRGTRVLKTVTKELHGRSLPEEFVFAVKDNDGKWYALPNNIVDNNRAINPVRITVDNETTPTQATYAPTTTVFKGDGRYAALTNIYGIRFTDGVIRDEKYNHLQVSTTSTTNYMWLSYTGSSTCQDWMLQTSDLSVYTLKLPTSGNATKQMGIKGHNFGYYESPTSGMVYILPIEHKLSLRAASVTEWGQNSVVLAVSASDASSIKAHVENGNLTDKQTITPVNETAAKAKNFRVPLGDIDLADLSASEGKLLYINWLDGSDEVIATTCLSIPRIIADSRDMYKTGETTKGPWETEVHVLPGATLTANTNSYSPSGATIKELHIYPGATLNVSTGTLTATTLRLHNGWTRAGEKQYNVARVYIADDAALAKTNETTASMDYDIYDSGEGKHYYPLAVPFQTAVNTIDYVDGALATASVYGKHFAIKEYDGANRATSGEDSDNNWDVVSESGNLVPGKGYIMTALAVKGEAVIRIPLTWNEAWTNDGEKGTANYDDADHTKNVIAVTAHTGSAATAHQRHAGWNMLGVPFMSCYGKGAGTNIFPDATATLINGDIVITPGDADPYSYDNTTIPYVSVPSHDFAEYIQTDITEAKLRPGWCFFIQAAKSGDLTFAQANQQTADGSPIYAPQRTADSNPVLKTGVILYSDDDESSDKFGLVISDRYTSDYEVGADLEKMFGNGYTLATYSLSQGTRLAFNALSTAEAAQVIPVGYRAPEAGQYTFAINPRYATEGLLRVELIDYQTMEVTDLLTDTYTFSTARTQDDTRFAIHVIYTDPQSETPTGTPPPVTGSEDVLTRKFIKNGCIYIQRGNRIYDATGKEVRL